METDWLIKLHEIARPQTERRARPRQRDVGMVLTERGRVRILARSKGRHCGSDPSLKEGERGHGIDLRKQHSRAWKRSQSADRELHWHDLDAVHGSPNVCQSVIFYLS
jgi:hypothetical protein